MSEAIENDNLVEPGRWAHALESITGVMPRNRCHTVCGWGLLALVSYLTLSLAWDIYDGIVTMFSEIGFWSVMNVIMTYTMLPILSSFTVYAIMFALFASWMAFKARRINNRFHGRKVNKFFCKPYNIGSGHEISQDFNLGEDIADNIDTIKFATHFWRYSGVFLFSASLLTMIFAHVPGQMSGGMWQNLKLDGAYLLLGFATLFSVLAHLVIRFCDALLSAQLIAYRAT